MEVVPTIKKRNKRKPTHFCGVCNRGYVGLWALTAHTRVHTKEKPYKCTTCEKFFSTEGARKVHERMHSDVQLYTCTTCGRHYPTPYKLTEHERTHTGERPYKCHECGKAFVRSYDLTSHMRIHSGDRPFKCEICDKDFLLSSALKKHMRIHSGDLPYACSSCDKKFAQSRCMRRHELIVHQSGSVKCKQMRNVTNTKERLRRKNNPQCKAVSLCRNRLTLWMRSKGGLKSGHTESLIGCTWKQLVTHLNNNSRNLKVGQEGVHIDHIRPCCSFMDFNDPVEQRACFNWNNLQLLTAKENMNKGGKFNADEYDKTPAGIEIARLRLVWVMGCVE